MNCSNCGTFNNDGSKFCINCGQSLVNNQKKIDPQLNKNENNFQSGNTTIQSIDHNVATTKLLLVSYFFTILAVILKPSTVYKEELNKFNELKNSIILSSVISGIVTLVNLITTMLTVVRVRSLSWSSGGYATTWQWENLKQLNYIQLIGKNFLIYLGIIALIAVVYYIAGLIIKKQTNFSRMLGISALAVVPMLICISFLSPVLSMISAQLTMPIILIGIVYTIIILYEGMNREVPLEGNVRYYFNLVCLSILIVAGYYLMLKLMMSSISGAFENVMDLLG